MAIKFFNTLTRKKEVFKPIKAKQILMYNCGPTVYDRPHIGNMRSFVFADILRRFLEFSGFKVKQVMNITDVDDKTIRDSGAEGVSLKEFTERYTKIFFDYLDFLNIKRASLYPRATENVKEAIEMARELVKKGYAYEMDGSVYFSIKKFKNYGKLAHLDMKNMKIGARIAADEYEKDDPQDFVLMKRSTTEELKRGIFYETEWGNVRPGWHIECSVMVRKFLGDIIDIHTGGVDNMFPHHENEIAQSEAFLGKKHVNYWMHCEHLLLNGEKMSKSLGNIVTLDDVIEKFSPEILRYMFASVHWKKKLNYTNDFANNAKRNYEKLKETFDKINFSLKSSTSKKNEYDKTFVKKMKLIENKFTEAMSNNLNTPLALKILHQFSKEINKYLEEGRNKKTLEIALKKFKEFSDVLGLKFEISEEKLSEDVENLIEEREMARKNGDWKRADEIRNRLKDMGIVLEDTAEGIRWKKK